MNELFINALMLHNKKRIKILQSHCWPIGRQIDVSVAGCFFKGQVASLSPNLAAGGTNPGPRIAKQSINRLCYNRLLLHNAMKKFAYFTNLSKHTFLRRYQIIHLKNSRT